MSRRLAVSDVDRERLINAYEANEDYVAVADTLGKQRRTACQIVLIYARTGRRKALPRGGKRPHLFTPEMDDELIRFVEEKPTATLEEMRTRLLLRFPLRPVSTTTIMRRLDGSLITLKLLRTVTFNWNTNEVKEERLFYARWMMSVGVTQRLVYTDECGFNVWTARSQGRSCRGVRAVRIVNGQRGQNLTVCLAVSQHYGLVHYCCITGGMTQEKYAAFLSEVSSLLDDDSVTIVHDNAPSHRNPPFLKDEHKVMCLPRYSPFLNPTEAAISCLKSAVKRHLTEPSVQISFSDHDAARQQSRTLHEHRLALLREAIHTHVEVVTVEKCIGWHGHSMTYIQKCLESQDIFS